MRYLLVAEKPSLMRAIQSCYYNHKQEINEKIGDISFIALSGHMCTNCTPDEYPQWEGKRWDEINYPIIPSCWKIRPIDAKKLSQIRSMADDYDGFIAATDSDVEGYGVYYLVEQYLNLNKPTLRFIEHSQTDKEIFDQLLKMTDLHKDPVHVRWKDAFLIRSRADWLFGMNCTRIMSVKTGETMRIGRVKAPTIKLIYDNSMSIDNFKPEIYYIVEADYGDFRSVLVNADGTQARFKGNVGEYDPHGVVDSIETKRVYTHAPKLYDLTALQAEARYTPDRTLEIVQSLYEKQFVSYPRTQCRFVSTEKADEFREMIANMSVFEDLRDIAVSDKAIESVKHDKQVVNDKEVQKEAHDALLPTLVPADVASLTEEEKDICHMIYFRLLQQFMPKFTEDKTTVRILHGDDVFVASGNVVINQGWKRNAPKETCLPKLTEGQELVAEISPVKKTTTPPKRLTQSSLVNAMKNIANMIEDKELKKTLAESQGIGTSATRASIIKEIIDSGYAKSKHNSLYITDLGISYIESLKGIQIAMPEFAALMDADIKKVQRGEDDFETVYNRILASLQSMCAEMEKLQSGTECCPRCKARLVADKYAYKCPACDFKIYKNICTKSITPDILHVLVTGGTTEEYKLKSKEGKPFRAKFTLDEDYRLKFDFSSGIRCPVCGADVVLNRGGAFCDCGFKAYRRTYGASLSDKQLKRLLETGEIEVNSFVSKAGNPFSGTLYIDDDTVKLKF